MKAVDMHRISIYSEARRIYSLQEVDNKLSKSLVRICFAIEVLHLIAHDSRLNPGVCTVSRKLEMIQIGKGRPHRVGRFGAVGFNSREETAGSYENIIRPRRFDPT